MNAPRESLIAGLRPMTPLELLIWAGGVGVGLVAGIALGFWVWA